MESKNVRNVDILNLVSGYTEHFMKFSLSLIIKKEDLSKNYKLNER